MQHAVAEHRPRLIWVSATGKLAPARARALAHWIASLPRTTTVLVGGQTSSAIADAHPAVRHAETMAELAGVARKLAGRPAPR
jgi:hypothetical protein